MKKFKYTDSPIEVHGIPFYKENGKLNRIPEADIGKFPRLSHLGKRTPGARLCFRTNSENLLVRMTLETLSVDIGMSIFGCQSVSVLVGDRGHERFAGLLCPNNYETKTVEKIFKKSLDNRKTLCYNAVEIKEKGDISWAPI